MSCKTGLLMPVEEYKETLDIEDRLAHMRARNELMKGILNPLKDHIFQLFMRGLKW